MNPPVRKRGTSLLRHTVKRPVANGLEHQRFMATNVSLCGVVLSRVEHDRRLPMCRWCSIVKRYRGTIPKPVHADDNQA